MNADEDYGFDVAGFLHLPQVLTDAEVKACNKAIDAVGQEEGMLQKLLQHPVLQRYLESLCGPEFAMDQPPSVVANAPNTATGVRLLGHDPERNRRLRYVNYAETRISHGIRVVWALSPRPEEGGIVLVPASHTRSMTPPAEFLNG